MSILIPYTYPHNNFNCDFIIQTAKILAKKKLKVTLALYNQPQTFLWHLLQIPGLKKQNHPIFEKFSISEKKFIKIVFPLKLELGDRIDRYLRQFSIFSSLLKLNETSVLWMFNPEDSVFLRKYPKKNYLKIYDCVDYFTSLDPQTAKIIQHQQSRLLQHADIVFVNSNSLYETFQHAVSRLVLVPQGFDLHVSKKVKTKIKNSIQKSIKNKRICFVGSLTYRINLPLLIELIKNNPEHTFILPSTVLKIEPEHTLKNIDELIESLKKFSNIEWIPQKNRGEILDLISTSDICLIPYDISYSFNYYSYPMKLFEYFYLGKPVLSTPIKELTLPKFKGLVYTGKTSTDWQKNLDYLLSKPWPQNKKTDQKKLAIENSWDNKVEKILMNIGINNGKNT